VSLQTTACALSPLDHTLHRVLAAPVACRPCAWRECPLEEHRCAVAIGSAQVLGELQAALS